MIMSNSYFMKSCSWNPGLSSFSLSIIYIYIYINFIFIFIYLLLELRDKVGGF